MQLNQWVHKWWHALPPDAQRDFITVVQPYNHTEPGDGSMSESSVQARIRIEAANTYDGILLRNNSGAMTNDNGAMVRFGLGNDSAQLNAKTKSHDLVGAIPMQITPAHVGRTVGVITTVEVKREGWTFKEDDAHEQAQNTFANAIRMVGGISGFAQSTDDFKNIVETYKQGLTS